MNTNLDDSAIAFTIAFSYSYLHFSKVSEWICVVLVYIKSKILKDYWSIHGRIPLSNDAY